MQDLVLLEKRGYSTAKLKAKFSAKVLDPKLKRLVELHTNRLRRAIQLNIEEAPLYGAIDQTLEAAQKNLPAMQARELASRGKTHEEIIAAFKAFKLERLLEPVIDPITGEEVRHPKSHEPLLTFNRPLFDEVFVPLVAAYSDIRAGKLYNDRNVSPRYKYSPARLTARDMVLTDIETARIDRMAKEMGYAEDDKQSIKQMAYYGICFNFPKESYWRQQYDTEENGKVQTKTLREGVRFAIPHPRRHFWDRSVPAYTLNSDTGVSFCGYWDLVPWRDIKNNADYWSLDRVTTGGYDLFSTPQWKLYQEFYPCTVSLPRCYTHAPEDPTYDRVEQQADFNQDELDSSVSVAVMFDKVIPKDYGLFDYSQPCWMRFIYCNLDTCIHAEVIPYTPGYVYLDRYDANKTVPSSLALQLGPFQQLLGNFLTQHFQSVRNNLTRIAFVNEDIVPTDQLKLMRRLKDTFYKGLNLIGYSKKRDQFLDADRREAVTPVTLGQVDTQQTLANINLTLMALERMLGFSAQEVGAAASHEQTAQEVNTISANTSVNLEFMGTGVDAAFAAKMRLLATAFYCYGDDQVLAEVSDLTPERRKALEELGFEVEDGHAIGDTRFGVKGSKAALNLEAFNAERVGTNRVNDSKLGIAMLQSLGQVLQNPVFFQSLGVPQLIELINYTWRVIGMPSDFRLQVKQLPPDPGQQQQAMVQMVEQAKQAIVGEAVKVVDQQIQQQVVKPLTQEFSALAQQLQQMKGADAQMQAMLQKMIPIVAQMEQLLTAPPVPPPMPPPVLPPNETLLPPEPGPVPAPPAAVAPMAGM